MTTTTQQQPYAVQVTLEMADGSTATRTYVRGETRMGRARFNAFALGDLLLLTGYVPVTWTVEPVDAGQIN